MSKFEELGAIVHEFVQRTGQSPTHVLLGDDEWDQLNTECMACFKIPMGADTVAGLHIISVNAGKYFKVALL